MGGLCDTSPDPIPTTTTVIEGTEIPEWVSEGGERLFGEAENLARKEIQPYFGGPRVASLSESESGALSLASSNVGSYKADIGGARSLIGAGTRAWTDPGISDSYINPYARGVTDIAAREVQRSYRGNAPQRGAAAVSSGAFGGARHGVMEAESLRNMTQAVGDIYQRGGAAAWDAGQRAFQADTSRQLQGAGALGGLAGLNQQLGTQDISNLMATGGLERGIEQASLDTAYGDFVEQREWPYRQLNFAIGALSGVPYDVQRSSTTQGQTVVPQGSTLQTLGGLGLAGAGIYSLMK